MKRRWVEHIWVFVGLIAASLGIFLAYVLAPHNPHLSTGVTAVLIMTVIMLLIGVFVWWHKKSAHTKRVNQTKQADDQRLYTTHWIEIMAILMVLVVFLGALMIQYFSADEFNLTPLRELSFPLFVISIMVEIFIILRSHALVTGYLVETPTIDDVDDLDRLKPVVARCMYMALVFIVFMLLSILFAGFTLFNWGTVIDIITGFLLALAAGLLNWYAPYEKQLKQIRANNALLDEELEQILQSWHNDLLPKF